MVCICSAVGGVCGLDFDIGESGYRRGELQPRHGCPNGGRGAHGVGDGVPDAQGGIGDISRKSWLFLILSGLATGASWLCYYKALQMGEASKVVPIDKLSVVITLVLAFVFLREQFTVKSLIGCVLITIGTLVMVL